MNRRSKTDAKAPEAPGATREGDGGARHGGANRFSVPRLRDARWIVGLVLLALGVAGTLRVITAFDDSVGVWSARSALMPGHHLSAGDLVRTNVRLDGSERRYLLAAVAPDGVVQRAVGAGELIPRTAVSDAASVDVRAVSVPLEKGQADVVRAGAEVEVWVADKAQGTGTTSFAKPRKLIERALVARIGGRQGGVVAVADGQPVEILVPRQSLADVIDAVNSGARITLVPLYAGARS